MQNQKWHILACIHVSGTVPPRRASIRAVRGIRGPVALLDGYKGLHIEPQPQFRHYLVPVYSREVHKLKQNRLQGRFCFCQDTLLTYILYGDIITDGTSECWSRSFRSSFYRYRNTKEPYKKMMPQSMIRQFANRDAWQRKYTTHPIVALYNTGRSLHIDQHGLDVASYYSMQWKWITYRDFLTASYAIVRQNRYGHVLGAVELKHSGHTPTGHVQISVRKDSGHMEPYLIPPMHILYLALTPGRVCDTLMIQQPLPMRLFPRLSEYRLIPVSL